jgi:hypothetical protein
VRTTFRGGAGVLGPGQQPGRALLLDDLHAGQRQVAKATINVLLLFSWAQGVTRRCRLS